MTTDNQTPTADTSATDDTTTADAKVSTPDPTAGHDDAQAIDAQGDTDDGDTDDDGKRSGNREAARYRRRLRETEAELATAATQLANLQRQQVETIVAAERHPIKAEALWATAGLADLLDSDGTVSTERVAAAIEAAREQFGIKPVMSHVIPGLGNRPQTMPTLEGGLDKMAAQIARRK